MKATGIALVVVFSKDTTIVAIVRALYHNNKVFYLSLFLFLHGIKANNLEPICLSKISKHMPLL